MKKLLILLTLFISLSSTAQKRLFGNGFYNIRNNSFGWLGTSGTDSLGVIDSTRIRWHKPVRPGVYSTAGAPDAAQFPGSIIYNTDSLKHQYSNGTNWLNLPGTAGGGGSYTFQHSLTESGGTVNLVNDEASPGNSQYYGTDGSGTKGFFDLPAGGGSGSPGGSATEMQYRVDGSTFGGAAGTAWDNTNTGFTLTKNSLGTTQNASAGFININTTAAANGAQQISPAFVRQGNGWASTGSTSMPIAFRDYVLPIQGTASATGKLLFQSNINGAGWTDMFSIQPTTVPSLRIEAASQGNFYLTTSTTNNYISGANSAHLVLGGGAVSSRGSTWISYPSTTTQDANTYSALGFWNFINTSKAQITAVYDVSNYSALQTNISGDLTITPSGGDAILASSLKINTVNDVTTPDSVLVIEDGIVKKVAASSISSGTGDLVIVNDADHTVLSTQSAVRYQNDITASRTVTLPDPGGVTGREIWVKWNTIDGGFSLSITTVSGTALIYLDGTVGLTSQASNVSFLSMLLKSDGTSWYKIN